jgi:hypothetical protein
MTAKWTKAAVLALARKKYGPKAELRENKRALSAEEKARVREQLAAARAEHARLDEEVKATWAAGDPDGALREAARFAVDVDGDEPSWSQLAAALARAERFAAAKAERADVYKERSRLSGLLLGCRWEVVKIASMAGLGGICVVKESADTLEEMAAELGG